MEKISKINMINKMQSKQKQNEYKAPKKKNNGFKDILEKGKEKLDKKSTEKVRKRALDAYKVQMKMAKPKRNIVNSIPNINIDHNEKDEENTID